MFDEQFTQKRSIEDRMISPEANESIAYASSLFYRLIATRCSRSLMKECRAERWESNENLDLRWKPHQGDHHRLTCCHEKRLLQLMNVHYDWYCSLDAEKETKMISESIDHHWKMSNCSCAELMEIEMQRRRRRNEPRLNNPLVIWNRKCLPVESTFTFRGKNNEKCFDDKDATESGELTWLFSADR